MSDSGFLSAAVVRERTIMRNVYLWMTVGLALTASVAWWASTTPAVTNVLFGRGALPLLVLFIAQIVLVMTISRRIMSMSAGQAVGAFALYSILTGLTLTSIFLVYTGTVIFQAFAVSGGMFAVMSLWAVTTKRDLSGWGHYLFMGLIGLIIAGLVGFFVRGEGYHMLYSAAGVVLFTALTAYDTQNIKRMSQSMSGSVDETDYVRLSILGALKLYLDFINMFLFLLRLLGRRR